MKKTKLLIFIVAYNAEKTIQSVLNQNYDNVDLIIIDGYTNDQRFEIMQKKQFKV